MKQMSFPVLLFLLLPLAALAQAKPYNVEAIRAFLYYNSDSRDEPGVRGTLSENLIDHPEFALWNTIIGEGSARAASNQTFVVVDLSGHAKDLVSRKVVLTVTANGKQVFKQAQDFAIYGESRNYAAAFLLYNTGCEPLRLKAEVVNERRVNKKLVTRVESTLVKTIPFACGE